MNGSKAKNIIASLGIIPQTNIIYSDVILIQPAKRSTLVRLETPAEEVVECMISKRGYVTGTIGTKKIRSMHPAYNTLNVRCVKAGWVK